MEIIPAIDIRGGRCVQLVQGDYARETVFGDDPVAMARRWVQQGGTRLHVVDLDGAKEGRPVNDAIVARIVREAGVPVQVAGGVRDAAAIRRWADAGAERIVIGTLAVEQPDAVAEAVREHGEKIAIALDVRGGKAAVKGWLETSATSADDFTRAMAALGARHFIYTDIARDGMLQHLDFDALKRMLAVLDGTGTGARMIYSGGVTSIADVVALNEYGLEGAIIGTALYDGRLDLAEALAALATGNGT
jgi:phosphoribosylformimino-5-aminoimidazole carboxamide ribotide isomerase